MQFGPIIPMSRLPSWRKQTSRSRNLENESPYTTEDTISNVIVTNAFNIEVIFIIAFATFIVVALSLYAMYSGAIRWLIVIVIIATVVYILARFVAMRTRDPDSLFNGKIIERRLPGDLHNLTAVLDRASKGMKYSQITFNIKIKDAFLEKVRVLRNLTQEDMDRLLSDPQNLIALINDSKLVNFILETERYAKKWPSILSQIPYKRRFTEETSRILTKMEAWR